jgi:hypothetical protein
MPSAQVAEDCRPFAVGRGCRQSETPIAHWCVMQAYTFAQVLPTHLYGDRSDSRKKITEDRTAGNPVYLLAYEFDA